MVSREEKNRQKIAIRIWKREKALKHLEDIKIKEKILELKMILTDKNLEFLKGLDDKEQQELYDLMLDLFLPLISSFKFVRNNEISRAKFSQKVWGIWRKNLIEESEQTKLSENISKENEKNS